MFQIQLRVETLSELSQVVLCASVPGMLNPVSYHPLLTGASLDHQAKAKVGIFGHFYLQAPTSVPADDWTILQQERMKIWPNLHNNKKQMVATLTPCQCSCATEVSVYIGSVMSTKASAAELSAVCSFPLPWVRAPDLFFPSTLTHMIVVVD